jgi:hypothetical protein
MLRLVNLEPDILNNEKILNWLLENTDKILNKNDLEKYNIIFFNTQILKEKKEDIYEAIKKIKIISEKEKQELRNNLQRYIED